jgi:hypothetical protein
VVYDIGGPRECIRPGETGFAVAFGDERKFFEKLELLVDDAALRRRMGRAARGFATTLSWRAGLQGVLDIHLGLAEGSAPPRVLGERSSEAGSASDSGRGWLLLSVEHSSIVSRLAPSHPLLDDLYRTYYSSLGP